MRQVHTFIQGWEWQEIILNENGDQIEQLKKEFPEHEVWINNTMNIETNYLRVHQEEEGEEFVLTGSLNYSRDPENPNAHKLFHYYVKKDKLITVGLDLHLLSYITCEEVVRMMRRCDDACEGFLLLIGEVLNTFLEGIDDFEGDLLKLERVFRLNNKGNVLEEIFELRSKLLFIKHLAIPVEEILLAMEEAFLDAVLKTNEYRRSNAKLRRTLTLLDHYEDQIETLLNLNMNLYSYRGNEIVKALTVFTVLVTPVTAFGAIWGMNFKNMPELDWGSGYVFSWAMILGTTLLIYFWLYRKGWTGDVLRRPGKNSLKIFKKDREDREENSSNKE